MVYVLLALAMLSLATGGVFCTLWWRLRTQQWRLQDFENKLARLELGIQEIEVNKNGCGQDFNLRLEQAEISNRIGIFDASSHFPYKYQYVNSLVEQGLSSSQIAEVLKISPQEAEQLVRLAQIAIEEC